MKRIFFIINFFFIGQITRAQLETIPIPDQEILELLSGTEVDFSNTQLSYFEGGGSQQIGQFNGLNSNLGLDSGIVLATHFIGQIAGDQYGLQLDPIVGVDSDLSLMLNEFSFPNTLKGVVSIEFDFVPSTDELNFNYVYGSNEYSSSTCSSSPDPFGIFISGPGISGPYSNGAENIALVPDPINPAYFTTTPVLVNSINAGESTLVNSSTFGCDAVDPNWQNYTGFYVPNSVPNPSVSLEGFTVPLQATKSGLVPCESYHIKFVIAVGPNSNSLDGAALFIEANAFANINTFGSTTNTVVNESNIFSYFSSDSPFQDKIYEGCGDATITFYRPDLAVGDITFLFRPQNEIGNATIGEDYSLAGNNIVNGFGYSSILLPAEDYQTQLIITPYYDYVDEPDETIYISIDQINLGCIQIDPDTIIFSLSDQPELNVSFNEDFSIYCPGSDVILEPNVSGGVGGFMSGSFTSDAYDYSWSQIGTAAIQIENPIETTEYCVTVMDICETQEKSDCIKVTVPEYDELQADLFSKIICEDIEADLCVLNAEGGEGSYSYLWSNGQSGPCNYDYQGEYEVVVSDGCEKEIVLFGEIYYDEPPEPSFEYPSIPHQNLGVEFYNYTNDSPGLSYRWSFDDGIYSDHSNPIHVFQQAGDYDVSLTVITALGQCEEDFQDYVTIDPNYSFFVPNAFSPNNDGLNDVFRTFTTGVKKFELFLFDSFGKMVFNTSNVEESWDGTYDGKPAPQGIYVYQVVMVKDFDIVVFNEQGAFTLIR
jgi:gliding motility-associated-like protein